MPFLFQAIVFLCALSIIPAFAEIPAEAKPAMELGMQAAKQGDYFAAVSHFEEANKIAPDSSEIYYNAGLAESKIPGREYRAIAWLGFFLSNNTASPKASTVKQLIRNLDTDALTHFFTIMEEVAKQEPSVLSTLANLQASAGYYSSAVSTAKSIQNTEDRNAALEGVSDAYGSVLENVGRAQAAAGDVQAALVTVDQIKDHFIKSLAKTTVAVEQVKRGDKAGALQTLEQALRSMDNIAEDYLKARVKRFISRAQALAGDIDSALKTVDSIDSSNDMKTLSLQKIAEIQAEMGDSESAQQTLAAALMALEALGDVVPSGYARESYNDTKARIDNGTATSQWQEKDEIELPDADIWALVNAKIFYAEYFDLKSYAANLPTTSPLEIFEVLRTTAAQMIEAHDATAKMLEELEKNTHG
jgi:tetratricopeptide (TPR) repeat protein